MRKHGTLRITVIELLFCCPLSLHAHWDESINLISMRAAACHCREPELKEWTCACLDRAVAETPRQKNLSNLVLATFVVMACAAHKWTSRLLRASSSSSRIVSGYLSTSRAAQARCLSSEASSTGSSSAELSSQPVTTGGDVPLGAEGAAKPRTWTWSTNAPKRVGRTEEIAIKLK